MMTSLFFMTMPFFFFLSGLFSFTKMHKHLLNTLLSLEFMMLNIYWLLSMTFSSLSYEIYLVLFFLSLVACEGALGLGLVVYVARTHGNDKFKMFNFLQC